MRLDNGHAVSFFAAALVGGGCVPCDTKVEAFEVIRQHYRASRAAAL